MEQKRHYKGLTDAEVLESRSQHGVNILTPPEKDSLWKKFFEKLVGPFGRYIPGWENGDPLVFILEIAALLSIAIACSEYYGGCGLHHEGPSVFLEPVGILIAIFLATGVAFYFEVRADKAFAILNQVNDEEPVKVIRNGNTMEIPKKDVVVGDIVILNTGDEVPADAELLEAVMLRIDESTLTGEPVCDKTVDPAEFDKDATFPSNHVMKGTKVMEGHGVCQVFAVGDKTENGKVFVAAQIDNSVKTPLNEQLDRLGAVISRISYVLAVLIILGRLISYFHLNDVHAVYWVDIAAYVLQSIMIAITVVVMAVPEGLPMSVTLSLALSMRRMLQTNNLVRKMHACETMGATTVICTDKTGTLTQNQMRIADTRFYGLDDTSLNTDDEQALIDEGLAVNSTAMLGQEPNSDKPKVLGNPTEGALLIWMQERKRDYAALREAAPVMNQLTFSTERKYMATEVSSAVIPGARILYVKGAPEIVCSMCAHIRGNVSRTEIDSQLAAYQSQAMRTLGFAYQILQDGETWLEEGRCVAKNLTFLGIAAIADPVRFDVPAAVADCMSAGINLKIVTGDTPGTAREIARQIGLWKPTTDGARNEITGPEFAALSDEELRERILDLKVISRARPMDKKRLVETLQELGQVVAVTGDGTNDAPALKAAQVGLSMGDGTSVAKEASDITIIDNSFASITRAVLWGRSLYQNIQRFILFQLTINVAACLIVLIGSFIGTQSPLTVTQILWVNLIMDTFAAMALASLPPDHNVMREKPRRREDFIVDSSMWRGIIGTGITFTILLLALLWIMESASITSLTDWSWTATIGEVPRMLTPYEESVFFTLFVMFQFWNMFNARAFKTGRSAFHKLRDCRGFLFVMMLILVGQIILVSFGGRMFNVTTLPLCDWIIIIASSSLVLWVGEIFRLITRRK